jgi:hypothetical protein
MPKEITHWLVADKVIERLERESSSMQDIVRAMREYPDFVYLGAILHDAPYYVLGSQRSDAVRCADRLHGASGENTFELLHAIAERITRPSPVTTRLLRPFHALLLGAITHICTDCIFHPVIYYASGNLHRSPDVAWRNHRALESSLDLALCEYFERLPASFSLDEYLHRGGESLSAMLNAVPILAPSAAAILDGYRTIARVRRVGTHRLLRSFFDLAEPLLPRSMQAYTALRYTSSRGIDVAAQQTYRHPVTGVSAAVSFLELFEASVQESVRVWRLFEKNFSENVPTKSMNANAQDGIAEKGASLEVGLIGVAAAEMRFFCDD